MPRNVLFLVTTGGWVARRAGRQAVVPLLTALVTTGAASRVLTLRERSRRRREGHPGAVPASSS